MAGKPSGADILLHGGIIFRSVACQQDSSRLSLSTLLRLRKRSRFPEPVEAAPKEPLNEWKIHSVREAISAKNLTPNQRKEHLDMNIAELRRLVRKHTEATAK